MTKAKVILFKRSGKYYTEEEWEVPAQVKDYSRSRGHFTREAIVPADMEHSPDFRRIDGGPVLVETQEPWGYPHLFPPLVEVTSFGDTEPKFLEGLEVTSFGDTPVYSCSGWPNGTWHGPDCGNRTRHEHH